MNGSHDCPEWVDAILESLHVESDSPGGLRWAFVPKEQQLVLAPTVVEVQGGAHDGAEVFSFYNVELHSIFMLFDEPPAVFFSTRDGECSVEGTIDDAHAWITFQTQPFEDEGPSHTINDGTWREKHD